MMCTERRIAGIALADALIGLLVISLTMVGVSRFQTFVVRNAAEIKARDQAIVLAQERIELFRHYASQGEYSAVEDTEGLFSIPEEIASSNTVYYRSYRITDQPFDNKSVRVEVKFFNSEMTLQTVQLDGVITWNNPAFPGHLSSTGTALTPTFVSPDGGAAERRDYSYGSVPIGAVDHGDGTFHFNTGATTEIINASGDVLLVVNTQLLTISGTIYVERPLGSVRVVTSDFGHCVLRTGPVVEYIIKNKKTKGYYTGLYTCYVAAGWYGSVGVVGIANNEEGCPDTARVFAVETTPVGGTPRYRGIEQNYAGQDIVISKFTGSDPSCAELRADSGWNLSAWSGVVQQTPINAP